MEPHEGEVPPPEPHGVYAHADPTSDQLTLFACSQMGREGQSGPDSEKSHAFDSPKHTPRGFHELHSIHSPRFNHLNPLIKPLEAELLPSSWSPFGLARNFGYTVVMPSLPLDAYELPSTEREASSACVRGKASEASGAKDKGPLPKQQSAASSSGAIEL